MPHPLFTPEVRQMLADGDAAEMRAFCENLHPATIAEALAADFSPEDIWRVLDQTSIRDQAAVFEYFPLEMQVRLAEGTGRPHLARLIEQMSHDDRADLLRRLAPPVAEALLRLVDEADRRDIATLVKYPAESVGALMTTDYAWLPVSITAAEAIERLRRLAPTSETIYYVYVLDETTRRLLGVVSLRDLIIAPRQAPVRDLMGSIVGALRVTDDRETAARELARYDFLALPVLDPEGRLVGIVTHDDVIDVVVAEATEDAHMMGAVGPLAENYLEAPFLTVWRKRAFWLACLFGAELFTFTALAHFEDEIAKLVVLSLFVPLCISTGGNSGSQAATLITRALALGQLNLGNWFRVLRHELFMGLALGLALGFIGFFRAAATPADVRSETKKRSEPFVAILPRDRAPAPRPDGSVDLPKGTRQLIEAPLERDTLITPPSGESPRTEEGPDAGTLAYRFPANCVLSNAPVDRWTLAWVIAQAVAAICLWGTLVGSMLPLVFKRIGVDPGIASSPFVATFVDVTGILIYFTIAKTYLL